MKLLILILLIFPIKSFADVRVSLESVRKGSMVVDFKTQTKADAWIADNISNDSWGKKERWEKYTDQTTCLEIVDVEFFGEVEYQNCKLPVEYTIVQTDITAEVEAKKAKKILDDAKIEELKLKDKDTLKLDELIELLQLKGII